MERILQYLDELDDLIGAAGLLLEKLRNFLWTAVLVMLTVVTCACGIALALTEPRLALATALLLFVTLLYRAVIEPPGLQRRPA